MIRILQGDCRDVLKTLADGSVQCCVTSPPYFGLRDYGTAAWAGGDPNCDHRTETAHQKQGATSARAGRSNVESRRNENFRGACLKCGAHRMDAQMGSEPSLAAYIDGMVGVFREVRRILRDDGTLWLNAGDSYNGGGLGGGHSKGAGLAGSSNRERQGAARATLQVPGLKPKDLMMVPARLAIALQDDGWWLRSQMPWVKRSCMPESITDRPTSALEYVYLLTKQERYFWDAEAIKKVGAYPAGTKAAKGSAERAAQANGRPTEYAIYSGFRNFRNTDLFFESLDAPHGAITDAEGNIVALDVNPQPFSESHFATFPPALVRPLIQAGTSERGCCPGCGAPWARDVEKRLVKGPAGCNVSVVDARDAAADARDHGANRQKDGHLPGWLRADITLGWSPTCSCAAGDPIPCTVLDPFAGAFTTAMVADRLQRDAIGIELNPEYCEMARRRIHKDAGMFANVAD